MLVAVYLSLMVFVFDLGPVSSVLVIKPEKSELVISSGDNSTISCVCDIPTTWIYPEESIVHIEDYEHGDKYVSILSIYNADVANVGFYTCYKGSRLFCGRQRCFEYNYVSIYIYVEDDNILHVGPGNSIHAMGLRNSALVIPCRPTSPNVTVKLYESSGSDQKHEIKMNKEDKDGFIWSYNRTRGFILNNATVPAQYLCTFSKGHTSEIPVSLDLKKTATLYIYPSVTITANQQYYKERDNMTLACEVGTAYGLMPTFIWKLNDAELRTDMRHRISYSDPFVYKNKQFSILVVRNISTHYDSGNYTCMVDDGDNWDEGRLNINIVSLTGEGSFLVFSIESDIFSQTCVGTCKSISWRVHMVSNPKATFKWFNNRGEEIFDDVKYNIYTMFKGFSLVIKNVILEDRGNYTIVANNTYMEEKRTIFLNVEDKPTSHILKRDFYLWNEEEKIECKVIAYPKPEIYWMFKSCMECEQKPIKSSNSENSLTTFISVATMKSNRSGYIECFAKNKHGNDSDTADYTVKNPEAPKLVSSNMNGLRHELTYPNAHNLTCNFEGFPIPQITWYKDNQKINEDNRIQLHNHNQTLEFTYTELADEGEYTCSVHNRLGSDSQTASLMFTNKTFVNIVYITVGLFAMLFLIFCIGLLVKIINKREFEKALKRAGFLDFESGAVESINPDLAIHYQTNLLPYDREYWEISKQHIKLGQQLGAGAFGVVLKAVIQKHNGCSNYLEAPLTVAVKMIHTMADDTHLRALVSELKIMAHLGKHLNVVNLVGAWTKHIVKRELYVIVEYCRYGNLHDYLLNHRENFINQIDPDSKKINYEITAVILESQELSKDMRDDQSNMKHNIPAQTTQDSSINKDDESLLSGKNTKPVCEVNYGCNCKEEVRTICTKDLVAWSYQVSSGMKYLESRKVLHGDLAARNILLADNDIVKISDFGLSRSLYQSDYKKQGDGPLPVKWMSVESIRDKIFSTQSDVWSFGIVLWEFFSLAETPYPDIEANEQLLKMLINGYRMISPTYATAEIYSIMLNCWESKPLERPSFDQLCDRIGNILDESDKKHYIDLNAPYVELNKERFQSEENDYLKLASPPDFRQLTSPYYVTTMRTLSTISDCISMKSDRVCNLREDSDILTSSKIKNEDTVAPNALELETDLNMRSELQNLTEDTETIPGAKLCESRL